MIALLLSVLGVLAADSPSLIKKTAADAGDLTGHSLPFASHFTFHS